MKIAGWLAVALGAILLCVAISDDYVKVKETPQALSQGFADMNDAVAFNADIAEADAEQAAIDHETIAGAGFLIAGIALVGAGKKRNGLPSSNGAPQTFYRPD